MCRVQRHGALAVQPACIATPCHVSAPPRSRPRALRALRALRLRLIDQDIKPVPLKASPPSNSTVIFTWSSYLGPKTKRTTRVVLFLIHFLNLEQLDENLGDQFFNRKSRILKQLEIIIF